jgi:hypothetical protein
MRTSREAFFGPNIPEFDPESDFIQAFEDALFDWGRNGSLRPKFMPDAETHDWLSGVAQGLRSVLGESFKPESRFHMTTFFLRPSDFVQQSRELGLVLDEATTYQWLATTVGVAVLRGYLPGFTANELSFRTSRIELFDKGQVVLTVELNPALDDVVSGWRQKLMYIFGEHLVGQNPVGGLGGNAIPCSDDLAPFHEQEAVQSFYDHPGLKWAYPGSSKAHISIGTYNGNSFVNDGILCQSPVLHFSGIDPGGNPPGSDKGVPDRAVVLGNVWAQVL